MIVEHGVKMGARKLCEVGGIVAAWIITGRFQMNFLGSLSRCLLIQQLF